MTHRKGNHGRFIEAVAQGRSYSEIAQAAEISIATVKRRLQEPSILEEIREVRRQRHREHAAQLAVLSTSAIHKLGELMRSEDDGVALRAVQLVLGNGIKLTTIVDFDDRLGLVERALVADAGVDDGAHA